MRQVDPSPAKVVSGFEGAPGGCFSEAVNHIHATPAPMRLHANMLCIGRGINMALVVLSLSITAMVYTLSSVDIWPDWPTPAFPHQVTAGPVHTPEVAVPGVA